MMNKNHFIIFGLLLTISYLTPVRSESDQEGNIEEKSESNPLETNKSDELPLEDKNDENIHQITESRVERSSEGASDHSITSGEVKTAKEDQQVEIANIVENSRRSSSDNANKKSAGKFRNDSKKSDSKSNLNRDVDDVDSERSLTNSFTIDIIDEYSTADDVAEKAGSDDELSDKNDAENDEIQGRSSVDDINSPLDSSRPISQEAQDAILDHKARTAQKFDENVEPSVDSSLEVNEDAKFLGSRRSFSGDPTGPNGLVNLGRTGNIFNDDLLPNNNQNPLQFAKIKSSETIMPNGFFGPPPIPIKFNEFSSQNLPQKPYDPFASSESKPLEEFNFNQFSNAYPYAYNPKPLITMTQRPIEINNFLNAPSEFFSKFPLPSGINRGPKVNILGDSFQPFYPVTLRPLDTKLSFTGFGVPRLSRFPNPPYFYRQKCSTCA